MSPVSGIRVQVFLPDGTLIGEKAIAGNMSAGVMVTLKAPIPGGLWVDVIAAAIDTAAEAD